MFAARFISTLMFFTTIASLSTAVAAQGPGSALSFKDNLVLTIIAAALGCIFGAVGSFCVAYLKIKELRKTFDLKVQEIQTQMNLQQAQERKNQEINLRLRYVNPLRYATNRLDSRLKQISVKITNEYELNQMKAWFDHIKRFVEQRTNRDERGFNVWCHYEGIFAMTTLYYTSTYFAHAVVIAQLDPFREINSGFGAGLIEHLNGVKDSFAQDEAHGIWHESQDNAGSTLSKGELILNYDEFCKHLVDTSSGPNYGPFLRLIDFYREYLYSYPTRISEITRSLISLQQFLSTMPTIQHSSCRAPDNQ